jgi:hypothetical protein
MDQIEAKLNSLDLKIPQPLKVPQEVKTPSVWIRLTGDKAYIHLRSWTSESRWFSCWTFW